MTKTELVTSVAEKTGLSKKDSARACDAFVKALEEAFVAGEKIQLVGFGTFSVETREARMCRNPKTGEKKMSEASKYVKYKMSSAMKAQLNQ